MACIAFTAKSALPTDAKTFKDIYMELKEINQIHTHSLV